MHTAIRGLLTAGFGLVIALGAGCAADTTQQPTQTSESVTVPASPGTTAATGIVSWEVYGMPGSAQTLGIAADGSVRVAMELDRIDDQTVALRTIGDHPEELRFTKDGRVLVDTLGADAAALRDVQAMAADVQEAKVQYSLLGCIGSALVAWGTCTTAIAQLGVDVPNDAVCVGSLALEADECSK